MVIGLYGISGSFIKDKKPEKKQAPTIEVWRLNKNVLSGEKVDRSELTVEHLAQEKANKLGFNQSVKLNIVPGTVFRKKLSSGTYLYNSYLVKPDDPEYINFIIEKNNVAYPIELESKDIVWGGVTSGSKVDVLAIIGAQKERNDYSQSDGNDKTVYVKPLFEGVKVLRVIKQSPSKQNNREDKSSNKITVILELTKKQSVTLMVAQNVSQIKLDKSVGKYTITDLQADSGNIIPHSPGVAEYRADKLKIN